MNQQTLPLFEHFTNAETLVCQTELETTHQQNTGDCFLSIGDCPNLKERMNLNQADN